MLRSIINYFWRSPETETTLEDIFEVLQSNDENLDEPAQVNEPIGEYSYYQKSGKITTADGDNFTVDEIYKFKGDPNKFTVGSFVSFTIYRSNGEEKITDVSIQDDWFAQTTNERGTWCRRTLPFKVAKREGRQIFLTPNDFNFDLNDVSIEFVPMAGDWVELNAKVELNEEVMNLKGKILEIEEVRPMGYYVTEGYVRRWCKETQEGVIDKTIFFKAEALMCGYIPFIGDKITAEVMESDQGECSKRAIKIVPQDLSNNKVGLNFNNLPKFVVHSDKVALKDNVTIKSSKLGAVESFQLPMRNNSDSDLVILNISYPSANSQCILIKPNILTDITIRSGKSLLFEGECKTKYMGVSKELILFTFSNFTLGCWLTIQVDLNSNMNHTEVFRNQPVACARFNQTNVIKGRKCAPSPRFVSRLLQEYPVPIRLYELITKSDKKEVTRAVHNAKPCLISKLEYHTYEDYFHTLLHLDEIYQLEAVKHYAQDYVCFIKNGEYLMLEIANLAERRPSLIVGDKIIAKDAYKSITQELEGYIHKTDAKYIYLKFSTSFHNDYNGEEMSIMALVSRTTYKRMHQAVSLAVRDLRSEFLFPSKLKAKEPQVEITLDDDKNWYIKDKRTLEGVVLNWHNNCLNHYQKEAVRNILLGVGRPLPYLIYGPPGTGKTVTLVETVLQILRFVPQSRIIVATPSNSAANLIAVRLIESGVLNPGDLIRLVGYHYVTENQLPDILVPYCATVDIAIEGTRQNDLQPQNRLTLGYNLSVIGKHRIIVGTCSTLGALYVVGVTKGQFTHVIIDEAGQSTEPEIMVPLSLLDVSSGQVVLAGDPCQLGPVILSKLAADCGLTDTFLDRMLTRFPYIRDAEGFPDTDGYDPRLVTKLIYNYRSLPPILNMFNQLFYKGQLIPTISETDSKEAKLLESLKEMLPEGVNSRTPAVVFHGVTGENAQSSDCPSWFNANEASQIFFYVNELYRLGLASTDIGIISPYIKQVRLIRTLLSNANFNLPKVGTVEDFQGHECNVILLTTVRSSENLLNHDLQYRLGFLSHPKRLNVAISRAQVLLIIVGNPLLLGKDPHWRSVIKYCIENGAYCGCELPKM